MPRTWPSSGFSLLPVLLFLLIESGDAHASTGSLDRGPTFPRPSLALPNQDTVTVRTFLLRSPAEQIDMIIDRIDRIFATLKRETDMQGMKKTPQVRSQHLRMAAFVDSLFFNTELGGKVTVDDAVVDRLIIYFDRAGELRPSATVSEILAIFLNSELEISRRTSK